MKNKLFKIKLSAVLVLLAFSLTACDGNDSANGVIRATEGNNFTQSPPATTIPDSPHETTPETAPTSLKTKLSFANLNETTSPTIELSREKLDILSSVSNKLVQYGVGKEMDGENRPTGATSMQAQYGDKGAIFIGENAEPKKLYLTFDEGYEAGYTPQILKTLSEKKVKATFFITGGYLKYSEDMVKQIVDNGHVLGNHTQNHPSLPKCNVEQMSAEINDLHKDIRDKFGVEMSLLRPPMGEFSQQSLEVATSLGYKSVFWSFAYADWDKNNQPDPTQALENLKKKTHNGAVILLHAVSSTNAKILGDAIDFWVQNGYELAVFEQ